MKDLFKSLQPETKRWVAAMRKQFVFESHHERLLLLAAQAWDRVCQARRMIEKEGACLRDRFGQLRQHPAIQTENMSMLTFSKLLREIGLDIEKHEESRPAQRPGGY